MSAIMPGNHPEHVQVLVAGAGPAGLTTAITLARQGIEVLLVERRRDLSALPRATVISTRSMELLRAWGLEERIRAAAVDVEWRLWLCETLALASAGAAVQVGLPTAEQSAVISPTGPTCVPQDYLEPVLLDHLRSLETARAEFGTELVSVDNQPDGVRAVLRTAGSTRDSGAERVVHARYLVAADGAHSSIRTMLGIAMSTPEGLMEGVVALFHAPLWGLLGEHRYGIYGVAQPEAGGTFLPAGRGDRWTYGVIVQDEPAQLTDYPADRMRQLIRLGAGVADLQPRIERIGAVSAAAQLAELFRRDSTFLVGDAAHRLTPRGGTGMNTAIHDGYDLGWKLAWVLRGWAGPQLLDTYEAERRPVAEHNAARSSDPNGSRRLVEQEIHADIGGRIPHLWLPGTPEQISTLDLIGPGLTLFTGPDPAGWKAAANTGPSTPALTVRNLNAITARAIGIRGSGALLTRPDGAMAGWWPPGTDAPPALRAAIQSAIIGTTRHNATSENTKRPMTPTLIEAR